MNAYPAQPARDTRTVGFTIPEVLVVIGVIAVLIAVLLPALTGAKRTADMTKSQSNMKQIATWMASYSSEHRDYIVPSQFDYRGSANGGYPVKVRSNPALGPLQYQGTWTDILWVYGGMQIADDTYVYDSPDKAFHDANPTYEENPLRSAAPNSADFNDPVSGAPGTGPKPFGTGATEATLPGMFAANNFFNTNPAGAATQAWYTTGQIKAPQRSMYLVDSFAGETIEPLPESFDNETVPKTIEVDFRYMGNCLMLFLDGHVEPQAQWGTIHDLEGCQGAGGIQPGRQIRIRDLTNRSPTLDPCP